MIRAHQRPSSNHCAPTSGSRRRRPHDPLLRDDEGGTRSRHRGHQLELCLMDSSSPSGPDKTPLVRQGLWPRLQHLGLARLRPPDMRSQSASKAPLVYKWFGRRHQRGQPPYFGGVCSNGSLLYRSLSISITNATLPSGLRNGNGFPVYLCEIGSMYLKSPSGRRSTTRPRSWASL